MKRILAGVMTLGVATMLSAAPQTPQTAPPDAHQQPAQSSQGGKHDKKHHSEKKSKKNKESTAKPAN